MRKLLPPILFVMFIAAMCVICWALGMHHLIPTPYNVAGLPLLLGGLALAVNGKKVFRQHNTNIMTFGQPDVLVTDGIFQYTRNPMYLGFCIALTGVAILIGGSIIALLLTALFLWITDRWYIAFEEQMMRNTFGAEYDAYCQKVRRWL
ncbi:methyltransferase family protein [Photobacterium sp. TY1-4]|uniref:methyltransferase family protein n=1 Tax=Photobacterium sp. TY1-4 TaxID=2899122 RepID=UPI0021BE29EE|nr:isoprenylcysteine carboxylmethyltransferase family protein [Photobacterium sp. TY1-4]UXI02604.1 isoprenylcysteine carboxylmethyltransferase family protein [Photobacterium sp. TY1-4]